MDKSFPLAEGAIEAEQGSSNQSADPICLNCNTPLTDLYCAHCGQKDIPPRQTFGELMINFVSSFWSFESKFFTSLKLILFKPGVMPKDYNEGKRERYFHPARMYVFISFIYFLFISILPDVDNKTDKVEDNASQESGLNWKYDNTIGNFENFAQYDSAQKALPEAKRDGAIKRMIYKRIAEVNEKYQGTGRDFSADFGANFMENTPRIFFVLLPLFALLLKLLYIRRDYFYSEHLVFSIYYYNFFFLAGSIFMLVDLVPVLSYATWIIGIWIVAYLLIAMKRMYQQSWSKTIWKYCTFVFLFTFCILMGLATNAFITFLLI
jgi:hypothetical protein